MLFNHLFPLDSRPLLGEFISNQLIPDKCAMLIFDNGINKMSCNFGSFDSKFEILTISENRSFSFLTPENARISLMNQGECLVEYSCCLELDTQIVSYLARLLSGKELQNDIKTGMNTLVKLLKQTQYDYSCFPYSFENSIKIETNKSEMFDTLLYFELFKNNVHIDSENHVLKETILSEYSELAKKDVDSCSEVANSEECGYLYDIYKTIYCMLLETIIIEFSSKSSLEKKLISLFDFINNKLGAYLEREIAVCYGYLKKVHDIRDVFFKNAQKNSHKLLANLRGMAWDLTHIRMLEYLTAVDISMMNSLFFHYLVSFDKGLRIVLKYYPVDRILFYKTTTYVKFKYPIYDFIKEIDIKSNLSENIESRRALLTNINLDKLIETLEQQLLDLQNSP